MRQDNWNIEQLRQSLDRKIAGTEERIRKGLEEAERIIPVSLNGRRTMCTRQAACVITTACSATR